MTLIWFEELGGKEVTWFEESGLFWCKVESLRIFLDCVNAIGSWWRDCDFKPKEVFDFLKLNDATLDVGSWIEFDFECNKDFQRMSEQRNRNVFPTTRTVIKWSSSSDLFPVYVM